MSLPASYYDDDAADPRSLARLAPEDSPWFPLYHEVATWLPRDAHVIDLGCGGGSLARHLADRKFERYDGYDFSSAYLALAQRRVPDRGFSFHLEDLRDHVFPEVPGTYVCTEVLEHLDDDVSLVERITPSSRFVFSVPNYPSAGHVRWFNNVKHASDRYASMLSYRRWTLIDVEPARGKVIHLFDSIRRTDTWR